MATMDSIVGFFKHNKGQVIDFIDNVKVNHHNTTLKIGFIEGEKVSVAFYIEKEPDLSITDFETKVKCLFNTNDEDIKEMGDILKVDVPCIIKFTPIVKIKDKPLINAFQMNINYLA